MARPPREDNPDRLSLRALAIASAASATAAVITSHLWAPGTALAAAVTPVVVAIISELLNRPAEHVSRIRASRRDALLGGVQAPGYDRQHAGERPDTSAGRGAGESARRRPHLKIALVTAALAFIIAVAALTLPELIFGRAVATNRGTTIFGGAPAPEEAVPPTQTTPATTSTAPAEQAPPQTTTTPPPRTSPPSPRQPRPSQAAPRGKTTTTP
jgi:hypothetical protein